MSTDLVVRQAELVRLDTEQLKFLAHTEFVPERIRGNLPMIFATIATGREIGIGDMAALRHIHLIDGKPGYSAEIMVALVRRAGHSIVGESNDKQATVTGTRGDNSDTITYTFTIEMAERAGLLNKSSWRRYPEAMLWARAVSQICRMLFPDTTAGFSYTTEELEDSTGEPQAANLATHQDVVSQASDFVAAEPASPVEDNSAGESTGDASPAQASVAAASASASPADDVAAGTPFSYNVDEPVEPAGSKSAEWWAGDLERDEPMWKKLNVLVGKLRPAHLSTLHLWQSMGREPVLSEDGELHWSPLRDSLTRREASELIDRLERYAKDKGVE